MDTFFFCIKNKNREGKLRKIFGQGKYFLWRARKREKEKEETIWRRKIPFCGGKEKRRRKMRTIFGEGKYLFAEEKKRKENI